MVHDVFVSAKSADYQYAYAVYKFLTDHGVRAFFSRESLPESGNSDYVAEIDKKLDEITHMVVVVSSVENAESPWVAAEWRSFINEKRSGRKSGNLITMTVGALNLAQLPASLRYHEVIPFEAQNAFEKLLRYVRLGTQPSLEPVVPSAPSPEPSPRRRRRPVSAFTNSLGNRLVRVPKERLAKGERTDSVIYVATTCVSNRDYRVYVRDGGTPPSWTTGTPEHKTWNSRECSASLLDHPVLFVSHQNACEFCEWLTRREQREGVIGSNERYALPEFRQWRAVSAGTLLTEHTVLGQNWEQVQLQPTQPVASGEASALGLFHLLGNVFEWCQDVRISDVHRSDGHIFPNSPWYAAVGGGWATDFPWLEKSIQKKEYGAILCPGGLAMKDGGFRLWFHGDASVP